jgi:hypothetical protein
MGLFDPTEIHNRGQLKIHMRDVLIKMAFYLVAFFIYLYWWVLYLISMEKRKLRNV